MGFQEKKLHGNLHKLPSVCRTIYLTRPEQVVNVGKKKNLNLEQVCEQPE